MEVSPSAVARSFLNKATSSPERATAARSFIDKKTPPIAEFVTDPRSFGRTPPRRIPRSYLNLPPKSPTVPTARTLLNSPVNSPPRASSLSSSSFNDKPVSPIIAESAMIRDYDPSPFNTPQRMLSRSFFEKRVSIPESQAHPERVGHTTKPLHNKTNCMNINKAPPTLLRHTTGKVSQKPAQSPVLSLPRGTKAVQSPKFSSLPRNIGTRTSFHRKSIIEEEEEAKQVTNKTGSIRLRASLRLSLRREVVSTEKSKAKENKPKRMRSFQRRLYYRAADLAELELDPASRVSAYMAAADAAVSLGHLESAEGHLRSALLNCGRSIPVYVKAECLTLLGIVAERQGRIEEAEALLKHSLKTAGDVQSYVPIFVLSNMYAKAGRLDEAHVVKQFGEKYRKFIVQ